MDLRSQLRACLPGRTCVVGVGNPDLGDDGFGVRLAERLRQAGQAEVVVAGVAPERHLGQLVSGRYQDVLFLDAVEAAGAPGSAVFLPGTEVRARFPQVSTHKISLGTLATLIEREAPTRVWLLGVKPLSLAPGAGLSASVAQATDILEGVLNEVLEEGRAAAGEAL